MRRPAVFKSILLSLLALAALVSPSLAASETGTHAISLRPLVLSNGPSEDYAVTGQIPANTAIKVLRCQTRWCLVDGPGGRGWTFAIRAISYGKYATLNPPAYPEGGPGQICFFTNTHYRGESFCLATGQTIEDLALIGRDNAYASVQLVGDVSVDVCRDSRFQSYCERIIASQPVLDQYLAGALSSIRTY